VVKEIKGFFINLDEEKLYKYLTLSELESYALCNDLPNFERFGYVLLIF